MRDHYDLFGELGGAVMIGEHGRSTHTGGQVCAWGAFLGQHAGAGDSLVTGIGVNPNRSDIGSVFASGSMRI